MGITPVALDLSYARALPVKPFQAKRISLIIVGLGEMAAFSRGTRPACSPCCARLAKR